MLWIVAGLLLVAVIGFIWWNRTGLANEQAARDWLRKGALVVDVRTESEFAHGHVAGAVNVPLSQVRQSIAAKVPDKNQVLLLHCAAGGRSALAQRTLREIGYANAHNLGSYSRAERVVKAANEPPTSTPAPVVTTASEAGSDSNKESKAQ